MQPEDPNQQPVTGGSPNNSKRTLIVGVIIAAIVLLVILIAVFGLGNKDSNNKKVDTSDASLYYDREGYDRSTLKEDIGDPFAIKLAAANEAQKLKSGDVVLPACSVLTVANLSDKGLRLFPNAYGMPVTQNYLSTTGKASFSPDLNNFPLAGETLGCTYGLEGKKNDLQMVRISVNQKFTAAEKTVSQYIKGQNYQAQTDVNGYKVFKQSDADPGMINYILQADGNTVQLSFQMEDGATAEELVKTAAANLNDLNSNPKGVSAVSYDSPTFTQSYAKACDLVSNDDLKGLTGADASPLVQESWPTAVGVADFAKVSEYKTKSNYIRSKCVRTSNESQYKTLIGTKHHSLQAETTTYENNEAATEGLLHYAVGSAEKTKASGIGDEAYHYKKDGQNMVAFRKGRVVAEIVYDFAKQSGVAADPAQYAKYMTPVAAGMADKLKEF